MKTEMIHFNQTMSTLDIATFCKKAHRSVLRDLKALEKQGLVSLHRFVQPKTYTTGKGCEKIRTTYNLPFRETMLLVSGYDLSIRAAMIDRWLQLESKQNPAPSPIPQTGLSEIEGNRRAISRNRLLISNMAVAKASIQMCKAYGVPEPVAVADQMTAHLTGFSGVQVFRQLDIFKDDALPESERVVQQVSIH